jgi:hypothetical protein
MSKKEEVPVVLNEEQMNLFNGDNLVLLGTIDADSGGPVINAISWVKAVAPDKIRFSVTSSARTLKNIKGNPRITLCVIGLGTVYSITGECRILSEKMEGVAMPLAKIEVDITGIYDSMFWGAKIVETPKFEKTYDPAKAEKLDLEVYKALEK